MDIQIHMIGPLIQFFGPTEPAQIVIPLSGTVASASSHTGWNLRPARSNQAELLHIHLSTVELPSLSQLPDSFVWLIENEELQNFSTSKTWEIIRMRRNPLPWTEHVWFKGAITRHAFHMWLTHLDRLPTRSRLSSWGLQIDTACCLCGLHQETRDHVFLYCEVSQGLWTLTTTILGYRPFLFHTCDAFSAWLNMKDATSPRPLRRLVAQAVIYSLWRERNNRYHNNTSTETQVLFKLLDRQIQDAILGKKHRKDFTNLMQTWLQYD